MNRKIFFLLPVLISGCTTYGTQFDCPVGKGLKCTSLSQVNRMVDKGLIKDEEHLPTEKSKKLTTTTFEPESVSAYDPQALRIYFPSQTHQLTPKEEA